MSNFNIIDKILECLRNSEWHEMDEIKEVVSFKNKFEKLIELLSEIGLIEVKGNKIRITKMGMQYLDLPD